MSGTGEPRPPVAPRRRTLAVALLLAVAAHAACAAPPDAAERPSVIAPLAGRSLLLDVAVRPDGGIVCVGERGHVLVAASAAAPFVQQTAPTRATLTRVYFLDARRGYAVGHDEVILRTQDGGLTWTRVHAAPEHRAPLFDVWMGSDGVGYAVGAYSAFLRSEDFGATWQAVPFAPAPLAGASAKPGDDADLGLSQPHLYALRAAGARRLYLAAEAGHLYRSDDAGAHWAELPSPYAGTFFGVLPLAGDALLAYGLRGHLYRSDDAGAHWTALDGGTDLLAAATAVPGGGAIVAGLSGTVRFAPDSRHFVAERQADRHGYSGVVVAGGKVLLVGEGGLQVLELSALAAGH